MNITKENMLQLYVEGNLPSEAVADFDRLVKEDAPFCESVVTALSQDLGPVPESTLDAMAARLDARYDKIWKPAGQKAPIPAPVAPAPVVRTPLLPKINMPQLPTETWIFIGGVTLFSVICLVMLTNPFQGDRRTIEENVIGQYKWVEPAHAVEAIPAPVVKRVAHASAKAPAAAKALAGKSVDKPALVQTERAKKAQALVELAMKSAPDQGRWVSTTAPRTAPVARQDTSALPDLPEFEEAPSYSSTTAKGDMLRLSIPTDKAQAVKVSVTDLKGRVIRELYTGYWEAGSHTIDWDVKDDAGKTLQAGEYHVLVDAGGQSQTQRVTIK